jgi:hypothetical protein
LSHLPELDGLARTLTVLFPWGSLLLAVASTTAQLDGVRRLCHECASFEAVFGCDCERERAESQRLGLPELTGEYLCRDLSARFLVAGFRTTTIEQLAPADPRAMRTT